MTKTKIFFNETEDIIDIRYDNVFKAVFTGGTPASKKALSRLISALIGREITIITINANEPPINNVRDRQISFDINCKAGDDELINVEMSLNPAPFEPVRLEFHAVETQCIASLLHELSKLDEIIKKSVEEMSAPEHWAIFFKYLTDKSKRRKINKIIELEEGIAMASEVLINISKDEKERFRLMSEYKYELDTQSKLVAAKRKGIQEGIQKGMEKEKQKIIDLLKSGKSPEDILKDYEGDS